MRLLTRLLASFSAIGAAGLVFLPVPDRPAPADFKPLSIAAPVHAPEALPSVDWTSRVRESLEGARIPIRGEGLEALFRTIDRSARRFDMDPLAILGVIAIESEFDPLAVSPRGAMGLMQLRADTARELAATLGIPWPSDDLLLDPDVNVLLGTFYLSRLTERFGDLDAALVAFHAGPGRVELFRGQGGSVPLGYANKVWDAIIRLHVRAIA